MLQVTIASCGNCGAALRLRDRSSATVTCDYCRVESIVHGAADAKSDAPKLRIDPPPALTFRGTRNHVRGGVVAACLLAGGGLYFLLTHGADWGFSLFLCAAIAALLAYRTRADSRKFDVKVADLESFRDNGLTGRATVERIRAGHGRQATLALKIELTGQPERHVEHETTIPQLLVPRLVEGLALPVLVHRDDPERIEVQWHLV